MNKVWISALLSVGFYANAHAANVAIDPAEMREAFCAQKDEPYCVEMLAHIRQGGVR
jgi:hypothetical protein